MVSYSLLDKPFVFAHQNGTKEELSLLDVFRNADSIERVSGDTDFQEVALMRLMLAICYRALPVATEDEWYKLFEARQDGRWETTIFPLIEEYLEKYRDRFDLLHPVTPFYQVPNIAYESPQSIKGVTGIDAEAVSATNSSEGKTTFFTARRLMQDRTASYSEAARMLVMFQQYRAGNRQTTVVSPDCERDTGWYSSSGWAGDGTIYVIKGSTFSETLLLNLVPYSRVSGELNPSEDSAVWERTPHVLYREVRSEYTYADVTRAMQLEKLDPEVKRGTYRELFVTSPRGIADLYTTQFARALLVDDGEKIVDCVQFSGDKLEVDFLRYEPMMGVYYTKSGVAKISKHEDEGKPKESWSSILATIAYVDPGQQKGLPARNLQFAAEVSVYTESKLLVDCFTFLYGGQRNNFGAGSYISRALIHKSIFTSASHTAAVTEALKLALTTESMTGNLYRNIDVARGHSRRLSATKDITSSPLRERELPLFRNKAYDLLGRWVESCSNYATPEEWIAEWKQTLFDVAKETARSCEVYASQRSISGHLGVHRLNAEPSVFTFFDATGIYIGSVHKLLLGSKE